MGPPELAGRWHRATGRPVAQINGSHLLGTFGCSRGHRIRLIGGLHTYLHWGIFRIDPALWLSLPGLLCAACWRHAAHVGERAGRLWLLCATSSRRCVFDALPQSRESVGWCNRRWSMRESCAAILHSHPARLRIRLGASHGAECIVMAAASLP